MNTQHDFTISVRDLERRPGAMHKIYREFITQEDMGTPMITIEANNSIILDARMESVHDGVLITGELTATATGQCSRCLTDLTHPVHASMQQLYFYPEHAPNRTAHGSDNTEDEEQTHEIIDDRIDMEATIRNELISQLPFTPICSNDCPGLCVQCGNTLEDAHTHDVDDTDSRWETLKHLRF